jgi:hypothetical protein
VIDERRFNAAIALKGETRGDAAKVMKIHPVTMLRKINGDSDFLRKEIALFCEHYNASPNEIFFAGDSTQTQKAGFSRVATTPYVSNGKGGVRTHAKSAKMAGSR